MKISQEILDLKPYVPGRSVEEVQREFGLSSVCKLASNENPLGPSPRAMEAIQSQLSELHRYPDGSYYNLRNGIGEHYGVTAENIVCGNGSNELIDLLIRILCEPGDSILISEKSFIAYRVCAQAARVKVDEIPTDENLGIDIESLIQAYNGHKIIFLPNPNNPTGSYINQSQLERLLEVFGNRDDMVLVLDEAYFEFVRAKDYPRAVNELKNYKNLVTIRTFAKVFGLAGLRVGALFADSWLVELVNKVRNPFNVNNLAAAGVLASLNDQNYIQKSQQLVWQGLDYFYQEFKNINLKFWSSQGNFVLFDSGQDSLEIFNKLLKKGVIIRPLKGYGFNTELRISVGLNEDNQRAIKELREVL